MKDEAYGTAASDAPITRADFERAVRSLNASDLALRDALVQLAARVVALTDEVTRRIDGVEPVPAPPNTPAAEPTATVEGSVYNVLEDTILQIRAADIAPRVSFDLSPDDKYDVASPDVPCAELIPLCGARCCTLSFSLSPADLDEGVVRWDYGQPYLIAQRASDGYCVHNHPTAKGCTVHGMRPRVCRAYDCRKDERIWTDYENRVPATDDDRARIAREDGSAGPKFDLVERARRRTVVVMRETRAIIDTAAEHAPRLGPPPAISPSLVPQVNAVVRDDE